MNGASVRSCWILTSDLLRSVIAEFVVARVQLDSRKLKQDIASRELALCASIRRCEVSGPEKD